MGFGIDHLLLWFDIAVSNSIFAESLTNVRMTIQDAYRIFVLPNLSDNEINASWGTLYQKATRYLGQMPVKEVVFDPSSRESVSLCANIR